MEDVEKNPWDGYRTLLEKADKDYLPDDKIPEVPVAERLVAKKGDLTWDINDDIRFGDGKIVIPFQREAKEGELIRDMEMRYTMDIKENLKFRALVRNACDNSQAARDWNLLLCKNSFHYFQNVWCWTFHPGKEPQPFVLFPVQAGVASWFVWAVKLRLSTALEKSREGGISWEMMNGVAWVERFFPKYFAYVLSMTEEEVDNREEDSLMEKIRFVFHNLPEWMRGGWKEFGTNIDLKMKINIPETDSTIQGKLTGGKAGRGGRANLAVFDEFAHVEDAPSAIEASSSLAFSKIFVSTVKGMGNAFARITHTPGTILFRYNNNRGFHWTDHPQKWAGEHDDIYRSKWAIKERSRPEYTDEVWAQEQDINYSTSTSGRVYQRFLSRPHPQNGWCHISGSEYADFERGFFVETMMDYGISTSNPNVCLFAQIKPALSKYQEYTEECLVIFDEMYAVDQTTDELIDYLKQLKEERAYQYGRHIGDLYTGQQRDRLKRDRMNIQKYMTSNGLNLVGNRHGDVIPILEVKKLLEKPGAFVINKRCEHLIMSLQNWSYPVDKTTNKPIPGAKPNHDQYSHANKALSYGVDYIYGVSKGEENSGDIPWDFKAYHKFGKLHKGNSDKSIRYLR